MYSIDFRSIIMCQSLNKSKFEYKKFTTLHHILKLQMISAKKITNIKVEQLIKTYIFCIGHLFIRESGSNLVHKFYILS